MNLTDIVADGKKIIPNFGNQNIETSGDLYLIDDSTINSVMSCATNTGYPIFQLRRYRGTQAAPAIVQNGDTVGMVAYYGHDGVGNTLAGTVTSVVDGTPSAGKIPISLSISTRNDANQYNNRVFISGIDGDVGVNTATPASKFHVAGDVTVTSATTATTVGAAGGASALPATPVGYLVVNINGTARKIPYYNV